MTTRHALLKLALLALASAHCGLTAGPGTDDAQTTDDAQSTPDAAVTAPSPSCAEVRATCNTAPQEFVRGRADGLGAFEGARVQFAVRYLLETGQGLDQPHGVVMARAEVRDGAFEACVCVPRNANLYPQIAAVLFAPGSTGETSRDVVRATFSQRYAVQAEDDVAWLMREAPTAGQIEAALAAMVERTAAVTVRGLDPAMDGARIYGGLVAEERPIAAQPANGQVERGQARLEWFMPGRQWPGEQVALLVDRNANGRCDAGDQGVTVRLDGRTEITELRGWAGEGAAFEGVCRALALDVARE